MRVATAVSLTEQQRQLLEANMRRHGLPARWWSVRELCYWLLRVLAIAK